MPTRDESPPRGARDPGLPGTTSRRHRLHGPATFTAQLWLWEGNAAWHFVTLPEELSDAIEFHTAGRAQRGFGSVRVEVTVGDTTWRTSLFPDTSRGAYVLPVKRSVRTAAGIAVGDAVTVALRVLTEPGDE